MKPLLKRSLTGLLLLGPLGTGPAGAQLIPMGPESVVVSGNTLGPECPQVIGHANRTFTVVWRQTPSLALPGIVGQQFDASGSPVGGPIDVDGSLTARQLSSPVTENRGSLGDIAVWSSSLASSPETTWRFNARVLPGGDMVRVNVPSYVRQLFPRRTGGYVGTWPAARGNSCSIALFDAAGHLTSPVTRLSNAFPSALCVESAQALDGSFAAGWSTPSPSRMMLERFGANGKPLGPPVVAIGSTPSAARLASAPDGRSAVTWVDYGELNGGLTGTIRLRFFDPQGTPASIPLAVDSPPDPPAEAFNPEALAMDRSGRALVVWQLIDIDSIEGTERYTLQLWTPGGPASPIHELGATPIRTGVPFCASVASAGRTWVVAWRAQRENGDTAIFVRRFFSFD